MTTTSLVNNLYSLFYRSCDRLGALLLPRRCVICPATLRPNPLVSCGNYLCARCEPLLKNLPKSRCSRCGLALGPRPQAFGWTLCRHCKADDGAEDATFLNCVVCCDYTPPFNQLISLLKYGGNHGLAHFSGEWLAMRALEGLPVMPDLLVPVPASPEKLRKRGYNQAALIAQQVGRHIQRPVDTKLLLKVSEAGAQAELNRAERLQNLKDVFRVTRPIAEHLRIGLVDDVITTGATLESCAKALRKAGAKSITIMAICRTPE